MLVVNSFKRSFEYLRGRIKVFYSGYPRYTHICSILKKSSPLPNIVRMNFFIIHENHEHSWILLCQNHVAHVTSTSVHLGGHFGVIPRSKLTMCFPWLLPEIKPEVNSEKKVMATVAVAGPWDGSAFSNERNGLSNSYESEYKFEYPAKMSQRTKGRFCVG